MLIVDHVFVLLLFLVQPIYGYFEARREDARERAGLPFNRNRFYWQTALMEWVFLAALVAAWFVYARPFADLGFVRPGGIGFWGAVVVLVMGTGLLLFSWRAARLASAAEKARQVESLGKLVRYAPHTRSEFHGFVGVSVTAGICEEIVYRGFVLWYLGQLMPLWAAVIASSIAFGLAHSYQGASGALRCGLIGLVFGILYVVTGSIWLPIVGHVLLDALQGGALLEFLRKPEDAPEPQPA
jgi:membrane protease YdiL (CAAX protease family)